MAMATYIVLQHENGLLKEIRRLGVHLKRSRRESGSISVEGGGK